MIIETMNRVSIDRTIRAPSIRMTVTDPLRLPSSLRFVPKTFRQIHAVRFEKVEKRLDGGDKPCHEDRCRLHSLREWNHGEEAHRGYSGPCPGPAGDGRRLQSP